MDNRKQFYSMEDWVEYAQSFMTDQTIFVDNTEMTIKTKSGETLGTWEKGAGVIIERRSLGRLIKQHRDEINEMIGLVKSTEEELELERETMGVFREGQELEAVFFQGDAHHRVGVTCTSITVSMEDVSLEDGQVSSSAWILVVDNDDIVTMWNAALIEGVELMSDGYE